MPKYGSKTQSKNGGRRRKSTMRKLRRARKSRKVMRGGAYEYDFTKFESSKIRDAINEYKQKGSNAGISVKLDEILASSDDKIGEKLSGSTELNDFSKTGIMQILNPDF